MFVFLNLFDGSETSRVNMASLKETGQWTAVFTVCLEFSKQIWHRWTFPPLSLFPKSKVLVDVTEAKMVRGWEVKRTFQTCSRFCSSTSRSLNHSKNSWIVSFLCNHLTGVLSNFLMHCLYCGESEASLNAELKRRGTDTLTALQPISEPYMVTRKPV